MNAGLLPVNEVFSTIQGEATWTGTPCLFIRLQGCPVGCPWCDTKHTWEVREGDRVGRATMLRKVVDGPEYAEMSVGELVELAAPHRHIVLTGGEPCMYDLRDLTTALLDAGHTVQIETSGTYEVRADERTWVTVSPKVGMPGGLPVLDSAVARANEIKHPVGKHADYEKLVAQVLDKVRPGVPVWLQPLSQSRKATEVCVDIATLRGHRVSIQTHKFIGVR